MANLSDYGDYTVYNKRTAGANAARQDSNASLKRMEEREQQISAGRQSLLEQHQSGAITTEQYNREQTRLTNMAHEIAASKSSIGGTLDEANKHLNTAKDVYGNAAAGFGTSLDTASGNTQMAGTGAISQAAIDRMRREIPGISDAEIMERLGKLQPQIQSTMSNTGKGMNFGADGIAIPGSEGQMFRNDPGAKATADAQAAEAARIASIKGYISTPIYDKDGKIVGYNKSEDEAETNRLRQEAKTASDIKAAADANFAAQKNANNTLSGTPMEEEAPPHVPNPDAFLEGLDAMEKEYAGTMMAPLFEFYKGQYAALQSKGLRGEALMTAIQKRTDEYVANQKADMDAMSNAWSKVYSDNLDSQLASAERTREKQARIAADEKAHEEMLFNRAIRDQNIKNEEQRRDLLLDNGISGGWRSSMHTSRMVDVMKKGERIVADLAEDQIYNSKTWANKLIDIESDYHGNVTSAYDAYNVNILNLADKLNERARDIDQTVFSNDIKQLEAVNKLVDDYYDGVSGMAESLTESLIGYQKDVLNRADSLRQETRLSEQSIWDDAIKIAGMEGAGKDTFWQGLVARANKSGINLPASAPNLLTATQAEQARMKGYTTSLVGKYEKNGVDYGMGIVMGTSDGYSNEQRAQNMSVVEELLKQGKFAEAGERILGFSYGGMGQGRKDKIDTNTSLGGEINLALSAMQDFDPLYGGFWKSFRESNKPLIKMKREEGFENFKALVTNLQAELLHARYGAAFTDVEWQRARGYAIDFDIDTAESIQRKLQQMQGAAMRSKAYIYDSTLGFGSYEEFSGVKVPEYGNYSPKYQSNGLDTQDDQLKELYEFLKFDPTTGTFGAGGGETSVVSAWNTISKGFSQDFNTPALAREDGGLYDKSTVEAWGGTHAGVDLRIPQGTELPAPTDGTIVSIGYSDGWGGTILFTDKNGVEHRISHLSDLEIAGLKKGDTFTKGQIIAKTGGAKGTKGAGNSTGPHVDYRIRKDGKYIDPTKYNV